MPQRKPGPVVTVEVPAPLGRDGKAAWLTQNTARNMHHRVKAPITKAWRQAAADAAEPIVAVHAFTRPVHITLTAHRTGRALDADGIAPSAKAAIDGLVDAGLLADDSPRFVHAVTYRTAPKASANVLTIEIKETR